MNIEKFEGWIITCPLCKHKHYVHDKDIAFDPMGDIWRIVNCENCLKGFKVYYES